MGITESWCSEAVNDAEVRINEFKMYRNDRKTGRGGGVLLYVHEKFNSSLCNEMNSLKFPESIWCYILLDDGNKLLVGVVYRSPNCSDEGNNELRNMIKAAANIRGIENILIMGDFNYPEIDFGRGTVEGPVDSEPHKFFECVQEADFIENVKDVTRYRGDQVPSRLDYILSNNNNIDNIAKLPPLGKSDHIGIEARILINVEIGNNEDSRKRNYRRADYEQFGNEIKGTDWSSMFENKSVDEKWKIFRDKVLEWENRFVPFRTGEKSQVKNKWMQTGTLNMILEKIEDGNSSVQQAEQLIMPGTKRLGTWLVNWLRVTRKIMSLA